MIKKKSQMLYQESMLIVFSILLISITLYLALNYVSGTKVTIEKSAPDLSYKFPASFVHGFLYTKVADVDVKSLGLDENRVYYVKDIISIKGKESERIVRKLRKEYIEEMSRVSTDNGGNMHDYYKEFSKDNYKEEDLLSISFSEDNVPILENSFSEKNYFYYIKEEDGKYTIIYFISRSYGDNTVVSSSNEEVPIGP